MDVNKIKAAALKKVNFKEIRKDIEVNAMRQIQENMLTEINFGGELGKTYRRNNTVVDGTMRDTYDLGTMLESLTMEWQGNKLYANFSVDYASFVLYGWMSSRNYVIPPRMQILYLNVSQLL